ncbi:glycosyltransferase [Rubellimicrobium roseum]|uniref:Glycosyltransferase family 4 protein n=1 Tax=Rubellimicrobium roseum TaxID=687525 RepID=A0A5C4N9L4_9RHOB|nr:glycosyltransferase [Rubellimicrobium roseum]TNC66819.1 glycosyltransferase family 4 protein [Rubellimicrobium roseum]
MTVPARVQGRRILLIIQKLAERSGGAERVLVETANALARRGYQVEIVTCEYRGRPPFYPVVPGVILSNLRKPERSRWQRPVDRARRLVERAHDVPGLDRLAWLSRHGAFWRRLGTHIEATRPAAAVAFMPPAITALALARTTYPVRRVASMHNAPEQDFLNPSRWDPSRLDRRRRLELMSRMDRIAVLLPEYRDWYPPHLRRAVAVLPNAVTPVPLHLRAKPRDKVVLSVGRLASVKRHGLLIDAWTRLAPSFPDWELKIFGDGPLRSELQSRIDAAGLTTAHLMGHSGEIAEQYQSAAILAHPAEFEGFPLAVTEALASGLPVIGFADCSGLNRLVRDGENGVLLPDQGDRLDNLTTALGSLMADAPRREALGAAGPASVEPYAPEVILDQWEELLFGDDLPGLPDAGR